MRIVTALAFTWVVAVVDLQLSQRLIGQGGVAELNPVARRLVELFGTDVLLPFRLLLTAGLTAIVLAMQQTCGRTAFRVAGLVALVHASLAIWWGFILSVAA